jgi:hypothetical protein
MSDNDQTYIVKRKDYARLFYDPKPEVIADFLEQPLGFIAEVITGMLADGPRQIAVHGGKIAQAALKGRLFEQFAREVEDLRNKGKIDKNFGDTKYGYQSWVELLTIIDNECPDADRLEALKAMFFSVNRVTATDAEKILAYQLFQIAKELTSSQLLLMKACYEVAGSLVELDNSKRKAGGAWGAVRNDWVDLIRKKLGHDVTALIDRDEEKLISLRLISNQPGITMIVTNGRLSNLGARFCDNIETYVLETKQKT